MSHPLFTLLMALLLACSLPLLDRSPARERVLHGIYLFACCVASVFAGGWIMHWIHG